MKARPTRLPAQLSDDDGATRQGTTKTARLLAELADRTDADTITLGACTELSCQQVWGLLKAPRACGQVRFEAGRWSLVRDWAGRDVERAAKLLRELGWRVERPIHGNAPTDNQRARRAPIDRAASTEIYHT